MPTGQKEDRDKTVSPQVDIRKKPQRTTVAAETAARSNESISATEATAVAQFRFRILVVDDASVIRNTLGQCLESEGYEVLTAGDGLDGLQALSKSLPDLLSFA